MKNKSNNFLVIGSIFLLTLCLLGISSPSLFKGTNASIIYSCNGVDINENHVDKTGKNFRVEGSNCLVDLNIGYMYNDTSDVCRMYLSFDWEKKECKVEPYYNPNTGEVVTYKYECVCTAPAVRASSDGSESCYGCTLEGKYMWSDFYPDTGCVSGWHVADSKKCSDISGVEKCYCFNNDYCEMVVGEAPNTWTEEPDISKCNSTSQSSSSTPSTENGTEKYEWVWGNDGNPVCKHIVTNSSGLIVKNEEVEGNNCPKQCYECEKNNSNLFIFDSYLSYEKDKCDVRDDFTTQSSCLDNNPGIIVTFDAGAGVITDILSSDDSGDDWVEITPVKQKDYSFKVIPHSIGENLRAEREGYEFTGWKINNKCVVDWADVAEYEFSTTTTVSACWKSLNNSVSIELNARGGKFPNGDSTSILSCEISGIATSCKLSMDDYVGNPTKDGNVFNGWTTNVDGVNDCTLIEYLVNTKTYSESENLYACWLDNTVTINYKPNGGTIQATTPGGTYGTGSNGYITRNEQLISQTLKYGESLNSDGLANWDNKDRLNISRAGYSVPNGEEWVCLEGCTTSGKTFSDEKVYTSNDFCDAKDKNCSVVLGVNWKKESYENDDPPADNSANNNSSNDDPPADDSTDNNSSNEFSSGDVEDYPDVEDNPKTGQISMFIVWVVATCAIVYSVWYFKRVSESK